MNSRDKASLIDIMKAANLALEFTKEMTSTEFECDLKTQSSVLYQIAILGEVVKRLLPELRQQYSDIPWSAMAGMRDKLIHDYDGVEIKRVWLTLQTSIPDVLQKIQSLSIDDPNP